MEKIFISACLLGQKVRYDGGDNRMQGAILAKWEDEGRVVTLCPEVSGGLPVPRPPCEIVGSGGGAAVLAGTARILQKNGEDETEVFLKGARAALSVAAAHKVKVAVLKEGSPSCGSQLIYNGSFSKQKMPGSGVTAALLASTGIKVFNEHQIEAADAYLKSIDP
jgi:uncharacterized protein YbbK (DUF523 family)